MNAAEAVTLFGSLPAETPLFIRKPGTNDTYCTLDIQVTQTEFALGVAPDYYHVLYAPYIAEESIDAPPPIDENIYPSPGAYAVIVFPE